MPPASRVSDTVGVPLQVGDVIVPIPVGVLAAGSENVLVAGLPAAREGDAALVGNSPDFVLGGELSVHIGNHEAARIGDALKKGPKITTGAPTVLIGPDKILPCDVDTLTIEIETIKEPEAKSTAPGKADGPSGASLLDGGGRGGGGYAGGGGGAWGGTGLAPGSTGGRHSGGGGGGSHGAKDEAGSGGPSEGTIVAVAKGSMHLDEPPGDVPHEVAGLLRTYDVVIDVVAGFRNKDNAQETIDNTSAAEGKMTAKERETEVEDFEGAIRLSASSSYHMSCTRRMHPLMWLRPIAAVEELPQALRVRATSLPAQKFHASPMCLDFFEHKMGLDVLFQLIRYLFGSAGAKQLLVMAESCGARAPGEGTAHKTANALVRIFRKDVWAVTVSLPAVFSKKSERKWTEDSYEKTVSTTRGSDKVSTTTSKETGFDSEKNKQSVTTLEQGKGQATGYEHGVDAGNPFARQTVAPVVEGGGVTITVTRNGRDFQLDLLNLVERVADELFAIKNKLKEALETLRRGPQVGFKFIVSFDFLVGSIGLEWEPESRQNICGRYWPVENKWKFEVKLLILKLAIDISFGIELNLWRLGELTLKAFFEASGALSADFIATWADSEHGVKRDLTLTIKGKLGLLGKVSVLGWSVLDAEASMAAGIEIVGTMGLSREKGMYLEMKADRTKAEAKIQIYAAFGISWSKKKTMWSKSPLIDPISF